MDHHLPQLHALRTPAAHPTNPRHDDPAPTAADPSNLPIAETFTSIQGEGLLAGVPSHFIRVSGCNLRCRWCDTPYASWNPEGSQRSIDSLVQDAAASGARHAVLTGGEPMLFPPIATLAHALRGAGIHITIETAGTIARTLPCDLMSISPKLANSTPNDDPRDPSGTWAARHEARRVNLDSLTNLLAGPWEFQLKFVIAHPHDVPEIQRLLADLRQRHPAIPPDRVLLMPEGVSSPQQGAHRWIADLCLRHGWRYCPRLHIDLFGNTRGT